MSKTAITVELAKQGDSALVTFAYNPGHVATVKRVANVRFVGPDKPEGPAWRCPLDMTTMRDLRSKFGDQLTIGPKLKVWAKGQVEREAKLTDMSQADDADLTNVPAKLRKVGNKKVALRPYQKADIAFMASTNVINANQPGAGKSLETIFAVMEAGMTWGQHLVFAPKSALSTVWEEEIKFAYAAAGEDEPTILTGETPAARRAALEEAAQLAADGYAFWLVLNPAMGRMTEQRELDGKVLTKTAFGKLSQRDQERTLLVPGLMHPQLTEVEWDTMTVDEFHLMGLSNPSTQAAQGIVHIAEATQPKRRYALSGTPMGGKPVKLWGALHFLEPENFTSKWQWARQWLVINTNGYGSKIEGIMPGREVDFYEHLKPYLVRRTKKEALPGLPPKQRINVWCDMTPAQRDQYVKFATDAEWRMADADEAGRLTATNVLAEYTRLKQFAGAYCTVRNTGKETADGIPVLKVEATNDSGKLTQLVEKLREENVIVAKSDDEDKAKCALVFSQNNTMVDMVAAELRKLGVPVETITGKTSDKNRAAYQRAFTDQTPGAPRVLVMNIMAGGTALNLSMADSVHLLDETWVPDNQEQAEDRAHRGDDRTMAKDNVRMYYYRTRASIEEYIQKLVAEKEMNNRTILDLRRRMQKELANAEAAA